MKIAVFFTFNYSVKLLMESGLFNREMKIYEELTKLGYQFTFFTYDKNDIDIDFSNNFKFVSIYEHIKFSKNKIFNFIKTFLLPFKISKQLKGFDVIHQHQLMGSWIVIILKLILKKPLLIRTGYDAYLFSIKNKESKLRIFCYKQLTKISLRLSDLYTVTSQCDFDFLNKNFHINRLSLVPNFVEKEIRSSEILYENNILMVGRLEGQKNYDLAFEFIENLSDEYTLDVYGSGSLKQDLIEKVKNKNISVNFLGNTEHSELMSIYKKYKYFLSTSYFEGNPKTVLEALNNNCIVFLSNIPNHRELVADNHNGFIFDNIDELLNKFTYSTNQENLYEKFKFENDKILKKNMIENIAELMSNDYKLLVSSK